MEKISNKKKILILVVSMLIICGASFVAKMSIALTGRLISVSLECLAYIVIAAVALGAMKMTSMKLDLDIKNTKQYFYGILIAIALFLIIGFVPSRFGVYLLGPIINFTYLRFYKNMFFIMIFVGPAEELFFREYMLETFKGILPKSVSKWLPELASAVIFGLWCLISGSVIKAVCAMFIGLVFGLAKTYIKDMKISGIILSHGLYTFFCYVFTLFIGA